MVCARAHSCCGSLEQAALNELVAQLVEQRPFKAWVVGSNPTELTTQAANSLPQNPVGPIRRKRRAVAFFGDAGPARHRIVMGTLTLASYADEPLPAVP